MNIQIHPLKKTALSALFVLTASLIAPVQVFGLSADQQSIFDHGIYYFDAQASSNCSTTDADLAGSDGEEKAWNYFKDKGLSDVQVAGIMGNLEQESGFDPTRMQKGGDSQNPADADPLGWGLIQWTPGSKVVGLAAQAGVTGPIYELGTQLDLTWQHMLNNPSVTGTFDMSYFKTITDVDTATQYFRSQIEGGTDPIDPNTGQPVREEYARAALQKYSGQVVPASTGSGCSTSSGATTTASGACTVNQIVYSAEYSQQQLTQIFGDPGTASDHTAMENKQVTVDFLGHSVQANPLIAPCLEATANDIQNSGINYPITDVGCYRFDSDNGTSNIGLLSYHTYGAACDINPLTNNYYNTGDNGTRPYDPNCPPASSAVNSGSCYNMPPQIVQIFASHGFYWGGNFRSVKDYMHFEWHGVVPQ